MTGHQGSPEAWRRAVEELPEILRAEPEPSGELADWWRRKLMEALPPPDLGTPEWRQLYVTGRTPHERPEEGT